MHASHGEHPPHGDEREVPFRVRSISEDPYEQIIQSLDLIVWESEVETCRFTFVSAQAERLLGYPVSRWLDDPTFWPGIIHPEDRRWAVAYCAEQTALLRGHQFEYRVMSADGRTVWLRDIVSVITEGGAPVMLRGVMVDITRQKQVELERDRLLARLHEDLAARDEFLQVASHELRTPVAALILAVQGAMRLVRRSGASTGAVEDSLQVLERQSRHLRRLVDSLLDVSRIQAGRLELELGEVDLCAVAREVVGRLAAAAAAAGSAVTLELREPVIGRWDAHRLEQTVSNLLDNAIKYGAGAPIEVRVDRRGGTARLSVQDRGIGIPAGHQARIFARFERAVSAREHGGLGLGLYIAHSLVTAHGGAIKVESEPGRGACFTVELPCGGPQEAPHGAGPDRR